MEPESVGDRGSLLRFFSNPAIGIAGSLASIVGLLLAVYFYKAARQSRDLCYFVHPAKAVVVKAGQSSRLRITLDGAPVERDVTAAQVAFWNEGYEPIRPGHVLRPLVISTGPKTQILEARLRKTRRDVSGIALDVAKMADGELHINWTILERHDGGVLQLIYLGDADARISATGTVEGQGDVRTVEFGGSSEQYQRLGRLWLKALGYVYLVISILMGVVVAILRGRWRRLSLEVSHYSGRVARAVGWTYAPALLLMFVMSLFIIFWGSVRPGPPFGFE